MNARYDPAGERVSFPDLFDRLASRRLVIVSGKGGTGRTTLAAVIGAALAQRGRNVLVATIDGDDRLATTLGLSRLEPTPQRAAERLAVQRLDPHVCLLEYGAMIIGSRRIAAAAVDNRVVRRLLPALPGLDDFSVLGKAWHEGVRAGNYDTVVFDGPPTGQVVHTLGVPRAILDVIPPGALTREARLIQQALTDPEVTEAVLVGTPDPWPLAEVGELVDAFRSGLGIALGAVVINGVLPRSAAATAAAAAGDERTAHYLRWLAAIDAEGRRQAEALGTFRGALRLATVPWRFEGIGTRADLDALRRELEVRP